MRRPGPYAEWAIVGAITVAAAVLRLTNIGRVSPDPFYDAAVRSMSMSWHNFFFGAFEPGGSVSIDKPPIDLWLQVVSVKLFGFSTTTLKFPEVAAGVISVPMLHLAVRRLWSTWAGIAAAFSLAVLPIEVITARSDTMDAVMMALLILALLLISKALESGGTGWLLGAAAALGVAFDVKLLESIVAVPGLMVLVLLGMPGTWRRRALQVAAVGAVYVVVALSWLTATLIAPASDRPWAIGSTNGSAWNAAFVFNGTDRLGSKSPEAPTPDTTYIPGHHYPEATQSERDKIPIVPASATRLLARVGPLSGERLGLELLIALLLGVPALIWGMGAGNDPVEAESPPGPADGPPAGVSAPPAAPAGGPPVQSEQDRVRIRRALACGLGLWMVMGIVLFSHMARLHPRYVEAFTPAVAAMLGIGVAWAASPRGRLRPLLLAAAMLVAVFYSERLLYGTPGAFWVSLLAALTAISLSLAARITGVSPRTVSLLAPPAVMVAALVCVVAVPVKADVTAIEEHVTDAGYVGALPTEEQDRVSAYVLANNRGAHYELAAESATQIGSLIVKDGRPILVLTTYGGQVFTTVPRLQQLIAAGEVRYALLNAYCVPRERATSPACSAPAVWIRAHGTDVSRAAGLQHDRTLWLLPGAAR